MFLFWINLKFYNLCFFWKYLFFFVVVDVIYIFDDVISGSKIIEGFILIIDLVGLFIVFVVIFLK